MTSVGDSCFAAAARASRPRGHRHEQALVLVHDSREFVGPNRLPGGLDDGAPEAVLVCGSANRASERADVAYREEQTGLTVDYDLAGRGDVAGDEKAPACLRLEIHERLALGFRRLHDHVSKAEVARNVGMGDPIDERKASSDSCSDRCLLRFRPQRPLAYEQKAEPWFA